jgi:hypothetical protein
VSPFAAGVGVGVEMHNKGGKKIGGAEAKRRRWSEAAATAARSFGEKKRMGKRMEKESSWGGE